MLQLCVLHIQQQYYYAIRDWFYLLLSNGGEHQTASIPTLLLCLVPGATNHTYRYLEFTHYLTTNSLCSCLDTNPLRTTIPFRRKPLLLFGLLPTDSLAAVPVTVVVAAAAFEETVVAGICS